MLFKYSIKWGMYRSHNTPTSSVKPLTFNTLEAQGFTVIDKKETAPFVIYSFYYVKLHSYFTIWIICLYIILLSSFYTTFKHLTEKRKNVWENPKPWNVLKSSDQVKLCMIWMYYNCLTFETFHNLFFPQWMAY